MSAMGEEVDSLSRALIDMLMDGPNPPSAPPVGGRLKWWELWPDARDDILWWCDLHNIDPMRTPVTAMIEADEATGEWRIEQWRRPFRLGPDGDPMRYVVRRVIRAPLPWPIRDEATWVR